MANPFLNDDKGNTYQLSCNAQGNLLATFVSAGLGQPLYMAESSPSTVVYEVRITGTGQLSLFLAPNQTGPAKIELSTGTPSGFFILRVFSGVLQLSPDPAFLQVIVVGQLLVGDGAYPPPLQPGGIGTPVTSPIQTDGEKLGLWTGGCGHWWNHFDLRSVQINGVTSCLVVCPICLYVLRIIQPYSAIHSDQNAIIFA